MSESLKVLVTNSNVCVYSGVVVVPHTKKKFSDTTN